MGNSSIALATSWYPRGELARFKRFLPQLQAIYGDGLHIVLSDTSTETSEIIQCLTEQEINHQLFDGWSGRYVCVRMAVDAGAQHIHYVDFDRLLRWVECHPRELAETVQQIKVHDLLIMGRSEFAWETHPKSMFETEWLCNRVFSDYFGREMDFGAGARGLSRRAGEFVLANSSGEQALNMDAGWSVLLKRGGFSWGYLEVDGLDWESADQYQEQAATREAQQKLAEQSDASADNWRLRTQVAQKIIQFGIEAMNQPLEAKDE